MMTDNTAWLANLEIGDEVGVRSTLDSTKIGVVKSVFDERICVIVGKAIVFFNISDGQSVWTLYGKSWLVRATEELKTDIDDAQDRRKYYETINNVEWSALSTTALARVADIIEMDQMR